MGVLLSLRGMPREPRSDARWVDVMAGKSVGVSPALADVNGDGAVNVADIATIIDIMAKN